MSNYRRLRDKGNGEHLKTWLGWFSEAVLINLSKGIKAVCIVVQRDSQG